MKRLYLQGIISRLAFPYNDILPLFHISTGCAGKQPGFFLFFSGPVCQISLPATNTGEYQWALHNNLGRLRALKKVLNIKTLDHIYLPLWRKRH